MTETPITCGSKERPVSPDATVTDRLTGAGAIIVGKTNLREFAFGVTTEYPCFRAIANPWDTSCVPGGSSGGSAAAVVTEFSAGAFGTDTGGSMRIPSAMVFYISD